MSGLKLVLILFLICANFSFAVFADEDNPVRDYLYSEEYFDYLIESAMEEKNSQEESKQEEITLDDSNIQIEEENEITAFEFENIESSELVPFRLRIEETINVSKYKETFKKEDTKTIIPVGDKFSFIQNTTKYRNKYNSDDCRMLAGVEISPLKFFNVASGLETNYRGFDQNPTSRKLYFTPTLYITDKLSLSFYNKVNVQTRASDHDLGINLSPFESKAVDFRIYAGLTRNPEGTHSESINFYTNFYFF